MTERLNKLMHAVFTWHSSSTDSKAAPVENITFRDKAWSFSFLSISLEAGIPFTEDPTKDMRPYNLHWTPPPVLSLYHCRQLISPLAGLIPERSSFPWRITTTPPLSTTPSIWPWFYSLWPHGIRKAYSFFFNYLKTVITKLR